MITECEETKEKITQYFNNTEDLNFKFWIVVCCSSQSLSADPLLMF